MYHLTTEKALGQITDSGLRPRLGTISKLFGEKEPVVWLFDSLAGAREAWRQWYYEYVEEGDLGVILEVDVRGLEVEPSWRRPEWWVTKGLIDPSRLDIEWVQDPSDDSWVMEWNPRQATLVQGLKF